MRNLFWLTNAQMARLKPFFPKSHGKPCVHDWHVLGGIIFVNRNGLRWRDAPKAEWSLADRDHDADCFREALRDKGIRPCIPGRKSRGKPVNHDKRRYKGRNRIEIMFGRFNDW